MSYRRTRDDFSAKQLRPKRGSGPWLCDTTITLVTTIRSHRSSYARLSTYLDFIPRANVS